MFFPILFTPKLSLCLFFELSIFCYRDKPQFRKLLLQGTWELKNRNTNHTNQPQKCAVMVIVIDHRNSTTPNEWTPEKAENIPFWEDSHTKEEQKLLPDRTNMGFQCGGEKSRKRLELLGGSNSNNETLKNGKRISKNEKRGTEKVVLFHSILCWVNSGKREMTCKGILGKGRRLFWERTAIWGPL